MPADVIPSVEPCESTLFSIYVNVKGEMFPCSFTEGTPGWEVGVPLDSPPMPGDAKAIWYHPLLAEWRRGLLASSNSCHDCETQKYCRSCPVYDVTICQPKPYLRGNESLIQIKRKEINP
jgi:radical SAM protein with 4Fe4S-binding SPASM domain